MRCEKKCLKINGADRTFIYDPGCDSLADVLRRLGLTGVKVGCGTGVCGACSVILDGKVVRSCTRKMAQVDEYAAVTTIEGIGTPNHPHPLQLAFMRLGAIQCGFCTPGFIVSAYRLLEENPDPSREEIRDWFQKHRNVCRCTGYKQIVDAVAAAAAVLRGECTAESLGDGGKPGEYYGNTGEYYGKPLVRPSALAKACGTADYGDDVALKMPAGTLQVVLVQPKAALHAKIKSIDISVAEQMPGVVKVITHTDIGGSNHMMMVGGSARSKALAPSRPLLAVDKIYNYGDVVALVAADTLEHARTAAAAVKIEMEALPAYMNYLDAVRPEAENIHENIPNLYSVQPVLKDDAGVKDVIESSSYAVSGSFYSAREPHLSIEGDTIQAYTDPNGVLTVHCKSQAVFFNMVDIAQCIGVEPGKIRVIQNPTGASFGWSLSAGTFALAAVAAKATDMPVALSMTYEEFMHISGKRTPAYSNARLACDENGKITALEYDLGIDHGAYTELGEGLIIRLSRFLGFPYNIPKVAGLCRVAVTNHAFGTAYRGYGSPQAYTTGESLIDMLAEKAGIDPFEFRYLNIARPGDLNVNSYPYTDYPMEAIMDIMRPLYEKAARQAKAEDTPEKRRGIGLAWGGYNVTGDIDEATVAIELNPDGTLTHFNTWEDLGQGGDIGTLMITLEALKPLGVAPERIRIVQNDSGKCPNSGMAASSRSHFMTGNALKAAADQLITAMRKPDGTFRNHAEMTAEGIPTKYTGKYETTVIDNITRINPNTGIGNPSADYSYALFLAEVEVDTATGKTSVLRYTCVDDVGVIGNIDSVNGQAFGGISHSIGFALSEQYEDPKKDNNMYQCGVPYIKDIPDDITVIHHETARKNGPFGSSGASEAFQSAGHMAVINAIGNACGVRIYDLPATPAKVKAGLDRINAGQKVVPPPYFLGSELYEELEEIKANPV